MKPTESKPPSKLFIPVLAGLSEHMNDSRMTPTMFAAYFAMLRQANFENGIWTGSAEKIRQFWNGNLELRSLQRTIHSLCERQYVKSFQVSGKRGNYPVAIHKYPIRFGPNKGKMLDALATTDPDHPVYELDPRQMQDENPSIPRADKLSDSGSDVASTKDDESTKYKESLSDSDTDKSSATAPVSKPTTKPATEPTTKPASPQSRIPEVIQKSPDARDVPEEKRSGGGGGEQNLVSTSQSQDHSGNGVSILIADMRAIWDHYNLECWNTKPSDEEKALSLSAQYGKRLFLEAFDTWCYRDAWEQLKTRSGDPLIFPLPKFFGQVDYYSKQSQNAYEVKRRSKPDACPIVKECAEGDHS